MIETVAAVVSVAVTAVVGFAATLAGCGLLMANSEAGWGYDPTAKAGAVIALLGLGLIYAASVLIHGGVA